MSNESSLSSKSESSNSSSPNQFMMRNNSTELTDLTLFGSSAPILSRTGTVRRASTQTSSPSSKPKDHNKDERRSLNGTEECPRRDNRHHHHNHPAASTKSDRGSPEMITGNIMAHQQQQQQQPHSSSSPERYRRSLDSTYRLSLESISEYKQQQQHQTTRSSFSSSGSVSTAYPSRNCSNSMESSTSDCTDFAVRSATIDSTKEHEKTILSPASSYLSWIGSVNSEYFGGGGDGGGGHHNVLPPTTIETAHSTDVDSKVGEWNNFWLNYNNARNRYIVQSSPYPSASCTTTTNEDRTTGDELSDAKSTCSTQREFNEKMSLEQVMLSTEEINEAIRCSQRITEILQNALKRNELEFDDSRNDSYYSQQGQHSQNLPTKEEATVPHHRERSFSYAVDGQDLLQKQQQKHLLRPSQSSSSSCINTLLTTGVADILKRVIAKRREVFSPPPEETVPKKNTPRSSFSEWSSSNK